MDVYIFTVIKIVIYLEWSITKPYISVCILKRLSMQGQRLHLLLNYLYLFLLQQLTNKLGFNSDSDIAQDVSLVFLTVLTKCVYLCSLCQCRLGTVALINP